MLTIFGGRVNDLESILVDERIPEGWESRVRKRLGLTFAAFNTTVLKVEFGINEKKYAAEAKQTATELLETIGYRVVDVGALSAARYLEGMAYLNIALNARNDLPWQSGWKLVGPVS